MINTIISSLGQVILFSLIPFTVYLLRKKSMKGFFHYLGLKASNTRANLLALLLMLLLASPVVILLFLDEHFKSALTDPSSVSGSIRQMGFGLEAIATILVVALIKTGLSEEIFFRGFVAKRLIAISNFTIGNTIQAVLFGAVHILLFLSITSDPLFLAISFIIPAVGAYFKVVLNEKVAGGSILPGWIAHGSANLVSYSVIAFVL